MSCAHGSQSVIALIFIVRLPDVVAAVALEEAEVRRAEGREFVCEDEAAFGARPAAALHPDVTDEPGGEHDFEVTVHVVNYTCAHTGS